VEYDSTKEQQGTNPLADFFKALVGAEFTLTIDKNMKVTRIEGREKFLKGLGKGNRQMKRLLEQILSEEALKEMADKALLGAKLTLTKDKNLKVMMVIKIKFVLPQEDQPPKKFRMQKGAQ